MKTGIPPVIAALVLLAIKAGEPSLGAEVRSFTSTAGTIVRGELVTTKGDMVTIKKEDGQTFTTKASNFSAVDLVYLKEHGLKEASTGPVISTKDKPFINSLGMKFAPVPDTKVLFCVHETRYKDYAAFAAENPDVGELWKGQTYDGFKITQRAEDHPVTRVRWEHARDFCNWLSKKEGKPYRLPSDQEWSIAVGMDHQWIKNMTPASYKYDPKAYPWGKQWPPPKGAGNFSDESRKAQAPRPGLIDSDYIAGYDDGFPTTAPVMSFTPNKFGLYDMSGNVEEWCENSIKEEHGIAHVLRGGSWVHKGPPYLLSGIRAGVLGGSSNAWGFRVVLVGLGK